MGARVLAYSLLAIRAERPTANRRPIPRTAQNLPMFHPSRRPSTVLDDAPGTWENGWMGALVQPQSRLLWGGFFDPFVTLKRSHWAARRAQRLHSLSIQPQNKLVKEQ